MAGRGMIERSFIDSHNKLCVHDGGRLRMPRSAWSIPGRQHETKMARSVVWRAAELVMSANTCQCSAFCHNIFPSLPSAPHPCYKHMVSMQDSSAMIFLLALQLSRRKGLSVAPGRRVRSVCYRKMIPFLRLFLLLLLKFNLLCYRCKPCSNLRCSSLSM